MAARAPAMSVEQVLVGLWKAASSHSQVDESARDIEAALRPLLDFKRMLLRVIDSAHKQVLTLAEQPCCEAGHGRRKPLTGSQIASLLRWSRGGSPLAGSGKLTGLLATLFAEDSNDYVLAIPLSHSDHHAALILTTTRGEAPVKAEVELLLKLAEPIAVAVSNHFQLQQLASLREAAEADKGALLRRLGRTDLGDSIIGESSGLRNVMERVNLVASSDAPVMILGETGSGKEVIARALHARSSRSDGPFIRVNCGAIPPELIDSQLFGHEKGAFTGADQARRGWFERADGGTLFLDEIGELPLEAQVRFLRVLQDGFVERVGSDSPVHVDVRVVAATHRDLASMVSVGKFREDLWYRVAVFPVLLPPLRDRKSDIPALATHFAERAAMRFGLNPVAPTEEDISLLQSYRWPGNIRELGAVIDRAAILGNGSALEIAQALGLNRSPPEDRPAGSMLSHNPVPPSTTYPPVAVDIAEEDLSINCVMKRHIEAVLRRTRGKIEGQGGAAEVLKINPHTLRARMKKLGISWNEFRK
jgi:hydrogenase-4 transcriptional activator